MERYIISAGDLFDAYHYGPFDSVEEANKWAEEEGVEGGVVDNLSIHVHVLNLP